MAAPPPYHGEPPRLPGDRDHPLLAEPPEAQPHARPTVRGQALSRHRPGMACPLRPYAASLSPALIELNDYGFLHCQLRPLPFGTLPARPQTPPPNPPAPAARRRRRSPAPARPR